MAAPLVAAAEAGLVAGRMATGLDSRFERDCWQGRFVAPEETDGLAAPAPADGLVNCWQLETATPFALGQAVDVEPLAEPLGAADAGEPFEMDCPVVSTQPARIEAPG